MGTIAWLVQEYEGSDWRVITCEPEHWEYFAIKHVIYFEVV